MRISALVALLATGLAGCIGRTGLCAPHGGVAQHLAHRLPDGGRGGEHQMVGAVRRPGVERTGGQRAAREPRRAHCRGTRRSVHRCADVHPLAVVPAARLRRRGQPDARQPRRPAAAAARRRPVFFALPGLARRVLAARPVRSRAPPERGCAGAGLCQRAGAARRRAVAGVERRDQLHRAARTRPPTGNRAGDGQELRRHGAAVRVALQRRHRGQDGSDADRLRSTSRRWPRFRPSSRRSPRRRT